MFKRSMFIAVTVFLIAFLPWDGSFAAPRIVYEEDFNDQPVGTSITSPPAGWTRGSGSVHNGELNITEATRLGGRAVDGSESTGRYSWAYKGIPSPVRPVVYTFTCRSWAPAGAHGCGVGFGQGRRQGRDQLRCRVVVRAARQ